MSDEYVKEELWKGVAAALDEGWTPERLVGAVGALWVEGLRDRANDAVRDFERFLRPKA